MNNFELMALLAISISTSLIVYLSTRLLSMRQKRRKRIDLLEAIQDQSRLKEAESGTATSDNAGSYIQLILNSKYGEWINRTSAKAGKWQQEEVEDLVTRKLQFAVGAFILIAIGVQFASLPLLFLVVIPLLAFFALDLILIDKAKSRITSISKALPDTIDLLNMCVSAGIGFHSGMQRVANSGDNPLSQEFSRVLAEMKLGQGRSQALLAMSERLDIEPLDQFVDSVLQVDRLGVPMSKVLEEQSRQLRSMRREKAREQAQKLPVKILAPTMLFMLPSLLVIVLGPAVVSILRSFS